MQKFWKAITLILVLIVSVSCGSPSAPETAAPVPTAPNPTGPYLLYAGSAGIWTSNPDGSSLTRLTDLGIQETSLDFHRLLSPQGDRLALIVHNDGGIDLVEVKIPGGETKTLVHLFSITQDELNTEPPSEKASTARGIDSHYNIAWQPGEGRFLAFLGGTDGPTPSLYVYDTRSGQTTQLTDGTFWPNFQGWSPDGKHILYTNEDGGEPVPGSDITIGAHVDGVWAVQVPEKKVITQPTPKGIAFILLGWQDERHYITYESTYGSDKVCSFENLRSVDVVSGEAAQITDLGIKDYIAYSPENGAILFTGTPACAYSAGKGTFLLLPGQTSPTKLLEEEAAEVIWLPESRIFLAYPEALFSSDGKTRYDPPVYKSSFQPALSRKGYQAWEVILEQQSHVEVKVPGADWQKISVNGETVDQMIWDPVSGETVLMVVNGKNLYAASYPDFELHLMGAVHDIEYAIAVP